MNDPSISRKKESLKAYIFMCNWETYEECIKKSLFGVSQAYVSDIVPGDLCFLYQYDLKILYGVWAAASVAGWHDPKAWNGRFKHQVRVQLQGEKIKQIPFSQVQYLIENSGTMIFKMGNDKAEELLRVFK